MQIKQFVTLGILSATLTACGGGDINISPSTSNDDNSSIGDGNDFSVSAGGGVAANGCATTVREGVVVQGVIDGVNCRYGADFVDFDNPLVEDTTLPFRGEGTAHIFEGSLWVGQSFDSLERAAEAGITEGGDGPTLLIEAGVTVAHTSNADFMVVNRGSQLEAVGTPELPITFTALSDLPLGSQTDPEAVSQWGGMVINGFGITNACTYEGDAPALTLAEGADCSVDSEGSEGLQANTYGGANNADSSGTLQYVVVKHTGAEVANGDELNGITFGGVGSGTTLSFIQTYSTFDDGIEFFGGAANIDHFVGLYVRDDAIDFDQGYSGTVEHALVIQAQRTGNHCVEADGVGGDEANIQANIDQGINSQVVIRNLTCILSGVARTANNGTGGINRSRGMLFREGFFAEVRNTLVLMSYQAEEIVSDVENVCFYTQDGEPTNSIATNNGNVDIQNSIFVCNDLAIESTGTPFGGEAVTLSPDQIVGYLNDNGNQTFQSPTEGLDPTANGNTGLEVLDGFFSLPFAEMMIDFASPTTTVSTDNNAGFIGAVEATNDWTAGWVYGLEADNQGQPLYFE